MKKKPLTNKSGRVRELSKKDIRNMRPASEVLPEELLNILPKRKRGERGPQKQPKKILVTIRYAAEVLEYFKATGQGWQSRIDKVLIDYIKKHPKHPKNDNADKLSKTSKTKPQKNPRVA